MYGPEAKRAIKAHAREGSTEAALRKFVILLVRLSFDRNAGITYASIPNMNYDRYYQ